MSSASFFSASRPWLAICAGAIPAASARAQLTDLTQTPNAAGAGIHRSLVEQIGAGRGDAFTPDSSAFLIERDPFRAILRGRQLFQRKFTLAQGLGPRTRDGVGDIETEAAIGAGASDSCAACHGRPYGAAGVGGSVFTRPDGRDAPHLFGIGLIEMLADEITHELRAVRARAVDEALRTQSAVTLPLIAKRIRYGSITALPDGTLDTSNVQGVNADLRVRPFFADGRTISLREFVVGALKAEMGLEAADRDLLLASGGADVVTPAGMLLSGSIDSIETPPVRGANDDGDGDGRAGEIPPSLVDHLEVYLLNYFRPGTGPETPETKNGARILHGIGCTECHVPSLTIEHDRRVADVETVFDPERSNGVFNRMFATATARFGTHDDGSGHPLRKRPQLRAFRVENVFADFKRHDLGPAFHERNFDGSVTTQFMTEPLWGVATTAPYGHDGRSLTLEDVILRHGGEAQVSRDRFEALARDDKAQVLAFLGSLVLFSPPDTASNLSPADPSDPGFPMHGHGSIDLSVLFNVPSSKE